MATSVITAHNTSNMEMDSWASSVPEQSERLSALKSDIHCKGNLLSSTWSDLYRLLSQYQAELFVAETPHLGGESELRRDLVKKDSQLSQLQHKLSLAETEIERVRLDLTVKNSLLQKYQDDLLEKEAALMTCQATIRKLENKHLLLENRMGGRPANNSFYESGEEGERSYKQNNKPPKGSLINASISAISQKRKASAIHTPSKRKSTPPTQNPPPPDDLLQQVLDDVIENNHTVNVLNVKQEPLDSLGECHHHGESVFPEPEEAPLPLEQFENWQNDALAQATGEMVTPSKKSQRWEDPLRRHACPHCSKSFTRPKDVKRHVNTVHLKLKSYGCPSCDKRFTRKEHSVRHLARCLGNYGIPYDASLIETYQRAKPDAEYVRVSGGFQGAGDAAENVDGEGEDALEGEDTLENGGGATAAIFPEMYDPAGYPCPTCHRIFTRQTHRKRHIDTMHSRVKRHQCIECGRAFARKDYLTKHFIAHHPELCGDFLCPVCGKKCLCQDEMTTHIYQCHSVFAAAASGNEDMVNVVADMKEGLVGVVADLEESMGHAGQYEGHDLQMQGHELHVQGHQLHVEHGTHEEGDSEGKTSDGDHDVSQPLMGNDG